MPKVDEQDRSEKPRFTFENVNTLTERPLHARRRYITLNDAIKSPRKEQDSASVFFVTCTYVIYIFTFSNVNPRWIEIHCIRVRIAQLNSGVSARCV